MKYIFRYDYVAVYDGNSMNSSRIEKYCGSLIPEKIISSTNELFIHFRSDSSNTGRGFEIKYESSKYSIRCLN